MSIDPYPETIELLKNVEVLNRHSIFQLQHFVLGKQPTVQAQLWQCLRELQARKDTLESHSEGIDEAKDDVALISLEIRKIQENMDADTINKEMQEIAIRKLSRKKRGLNKSIESLEKKKKECDIETSFFLQAFKKLSKIEQLRPYDDAEANLELWNKKLTEELNLRLMLQKPLDLELVKTARALPNEAPIKREMEKILTQIKQNAIEVQTKAQLESNLDKIKGE